MNDSEIQKQIEDIKEALPHLAENIDLIVKDSTDMHRTLKTITSLYKAQIDTIKDTSSKIKDMSTNLKTNNLSFNELERGIHALRKEASNLTDEKRKELNEAKKALEATYLTEKRNKIVGESVGKVGLTMGTTLLNSMTSLATSALSGASTLRISADLMKTSIDIEAKAAKSAFSAMSTIGVEVANTHKKTGILMQGAGAVFGAVVDTMKTAADAGIEFMLKNTELMMTEYNRMSSAGAIFTGGMVEVGNTAVVAGMSLKNFSDSIVANKDNLASTGLGIEIASKRMAGALSAGGAEARKAMFALGMSVTDQAAAVAETMSIMAGPTNILNASNSEIIKQTQEYATNLKLLSALTGEDAKAKQDKLRKDNDIMAFQQKLAGMDNEQRAKINAAMMHMNADQQRALRENMVYGGLISKDLAIAQATNSGVRQFFEGSAAMARNGSLDATSTDALQRQSASRSMQDSMGNTGIAMAGMAGNQDAASAGSMQLGIAQFQAKFTKSAEERDKLDIKTSEAKQGRDMQANLVEANNRLEVAMSELAVTQMPKFAASLEKYSDSVIKAATLAATGSVSTGQMLSGLVPAIVNTVGSIAGLLLLAKGGGGAGLAKIGAGGFFGQMMAKGSGVIGALGGAGAAAGGVGSIAEAGAAAGGAAKVGSGLLRGAAKFGGKTLLKSLPGIGLVLGLAGAGQRIMDGDFAGAGIEAAAGVAGLIPGIGTAASIGLSAGLMARDAGVFDSKVSAPDASKLSSTAGNDIATSTNGTSTDVKKDPLSVLIAEIKESNGLLTKQIAYSKTLNVTINALLETSNSQLSVIKNAAHDAA